MCRYLLHSDQSVAADEQRQVRAGLLHLFGRGERLLRPHVVHTDGRADGERPQGRGRALPAEGQGEETPPTA